MTKTRTTEKLDAQVERLISLYGYDATARSVVAAVSKKADAFDDFGDGEAAELYRGYAQHILEMLSDAAPTKATSVHSKNGGRRFMRGEHHGSAKLTASDVEEMRRRFAEGEAYQQLAAEKNVQAKYAYNVIKGVKWGHLRTEWDELARAKKPPRFDPSMTKKRRGRRRKNEPR